MTGVKPIAEHYAASDLLQRITDALRAVGERPPAVTIDVLAFVDEFHSRGSIATDELIDALAVTDADHVLDIGAGLGGPARRLAAATGCRVTGVDLSDDFVVTGNQLTKWVGLEDRVDLLCADATDLSGFGPGAFDAAWTIHVGMNIADKPALYRQVAGVLKPGAKFVIYDVLRGPNGGAVDYPMPWATGASASFLASTDEMRNHLAAGGFTGIEVTDYSAAATDTFAKAIRRVKAAGGPPLIGLHIVMGPRFANMVGNLHAGLAAGDLAVARIASRRA